MAYTSTSSRGYSGNEDIILDREPPAAFDDPSRRRRYSNESVLLEEPTMTTSNNEVPTRRSVMERFGRILNSINGSRAEDASLLLAGLTTLTEPMIKVLSKEVREKLHTWARLHEANEIASWCAKINGRVSNVEPKIEANEDVVIVGVRSRDSIQDLGRELAEHRTAIADLEQRFNASQKELTEKKAKRDDETKTTVAMRRAFKLLGSHVALRAGHDSALQRSFDEMIDHFDCKNTFRKRRNIGRAIEDITARGVPGTSLHPCMAEQLRVLEGVIQRSTSLSDEQRRAIDWAFENLLVSVVGSSDISMIRAGWELKREDLDNIWSDIRSFHE